jgi:hypothetical protein
MHSRQVAVGVGLGGNADEDGLAGIHCGGTDPKRSDVEGQAGGSTLAHGVKPGRGEGDGPYGKACGA